MDAQTTGPERGMMTRLRRGMRFLESKIGWSRIGFALSLTIILVAVECSITSCTISTSTSSCAR